MASEGRSQLLEPNRFSSARRALESRFVRFLLVGVLNTIFGYSIFAVLVLIGVHYAIAAFVSTVLGVLFNFKTTGRLVFSGRPAIASGSGQPVKDTLCGTKVLRRADYERIAANRATFGDFNLLFGAARLNLKIVDLPIRHRERCYGATNIDRWRHGALLFRMLGFAATRLWMI